MPSKASPSTVPARPPRSHRAPLVALALVAATVLLAPTVSASFEPERITDCALTDGQVVALPPTNDETLAAIAAALRGDGHNDCDARVARCEILDSAADSLRPGDPAECIEARLGAVVDILERKAKDLQLLLEQVTGCQIEILESIAGPEVPGRPPQIRCPPIGPIIGEGSVDPGIEIHTIKGHEDPPITLDGAPGRR